MSTTFTTQIPLTDAELKLLQTLVYQECGMYFDERRTHFLRDRLQRRLKACQLDSFYAYYRLLTSREGKKELTALLENLTVNETSFFRIRPQLELFQKVSGTPATLLRAINGKNLASSVTLLSVCHRRHHYLHYLMEMPEDLL